MSQQNKPDLSQVIAEEFGANATYVEGLLERFRSNPELVDESWRSYFSELVGNGAKAVVATTDGDGATAANRPHSSAPPRRPRLPPPEPKASTRAAGGRRSNPDPRPRTQDRREHGEQSLTCRLRLPNDEFQ